jgi:Tetratricopeptide repeat.
MTAESNWQVFGRELRKWREQQDLSLRDLRHNIPWSYSMVCRWESGTIRPPANAVETLDKELGAEGKLVSLAFRAAMSDIDELKRGGGRANPSDGDEDDMERRRLLQFAAAMGIATLSGADEPLRQLLTLTITKQRALDDWELACADHLHAVRTRPPAQAHRDLLVDLSALQRQAATVQRAEAVELQRVTAVLASYQGSVLTRLADPGAAVRWYRIAKDAADTSGDRDLQVRVRAHEAGHSLYGVRDPATVLRLCEAAERVAGATPSPGLAMTLRVKAHALARLGRHDEAEQALQRFLDVAGHDLPVVDGWWDGRDCRVPMTVSQVHAAAGRVDQAAAAVDDILATTGSEYQVPVNARLHLAHALVVSGDVEEGTRMAVTALESVDAPYRNSMMDETARRVLSAVPAPQTARPPVAELRRQLAIVA